MTSRSEGPQASLATAGRLAAHAVVVAIEMRAVAGIAPVHWRGTGLGGLRCSCGTRDARAMAAQRGPAARRGAGPATGRARVPAQPRGGSDRRRSCGRCGSRAGRGRRRARGRSRARACRRACRAQQGGIGAGQASWSAGEGLLQFASFVPHGSRCMKRRRAEHASMGGVVLYLWTTAPPAQRRAASPKARVADRCSTRLCGHARIHHRSRPAALGSRLQR